MNYIFSTLKVRLTTKGSFYIFGGNRQIFRKLVKEGQGELDPRSNDTEFRKEVTESLLIQLKSSQSL